MWTGLPVVLPTAVRVFDGYPGGDGSVITVMIVLTALHMLNWLPGPWW
ncbi:MAG: hypothetical protein JNK84_04850 [Phreatobacter sp.]|nr:hypothetical protein [Phreatobacter sp.]MBL8568394.1 hypothetical protein [Phreatobacter sp.]